MLADNRRHYELLVEMARQHAEQGDVERVLRTAMAAANYAWLAPVGLLSDLRLERSVVHAVRGSGRVAVDGTRSGNRVLHVLTEAYSVGGHTRLAWRWMSRDERTSDVVLTNQLGPVPQELVASVRATGGDVFDLRTTPTGLLQRARALRAHMDRADVVVLHVHPYDSVALAAVNLPGVRPPVVYENHADAAFWLGVAAADLLCDWRPEAQSVDVRLRGVPEPRIAVLPMPVDELPSAEGGALRHQLGIAPDAVVAVTVSADWKMAASWGRGMHHLVDRILRWAPQVSVVLVGATPSADWSQLSRRYPGRVFPVGRVPDPSPYFDMADIYLDSYPTRAGTSVLEAALLGLPVVALADDTESELVRLHQGAAPGLAGVHPATTADQCAVAVRRLASDSERRRRDGEAVRAAVLAAHDGPGWRAELETIYARARALPAVDVDQLGDSSTDDEEYGVLLLSSTSPAEASPDPRSMVGPLADLFDSTMECDLLASLMRRLSPSLLVRAASSWADQPDSTTRLLALAAAHPQLTVSLPLAAHDDGAGTRSIAVLTTLLADLGQTPDDCGDIRLEPDATDGSRSVRWDLVMTDQELDRLEGVVCSPMWREDVAVVAGRHQERLGA
ncbi:glycosyltransferase [Blastococcus litoris]|uniref:glycosyltransferase n=1 Tax=Blastococcus litoris TaxID=2171622 RepID=UPI000E309263|nr:glycosyltransferase [Blastococcus litoris]